MGAPVFLAGCPCAPAPSAWYSARASSPRLASAVLPRAVAGRGGACQRFRLESVGKSTTSSLLPSALGAGSGTTSEIDADESDFCVVGGGENPCAYSILSLGHGHVDECNELMRSVSFDTDTEDWHMVLDFGEKDVIGVRHGDRLVGVISAVDFPARGSAAPPPFGWLGNLVVHPDYRSKGLAKTLLLQGLARLLDDRGAQNVLLDASAMGKPVYDKIGFEDLALLHVMKLEHAGAGGGAEGGDGGGALAAQVLSDTDLGDVLALDAEAFGADRAALLRRWRERWPEGSVVVRGGERGAVLGYAFAHARERCDYVGPVVAASAEAADAALRGSLAAVRRKQEDKGQRRQVAVHVMAPLEAKNGEGGEGGVAMSRDWKALLEAEGWTCAETTTRQVLRGEGSRDGSPAAHPGCLSHIIACGSLDLG